MVPNQVRFLSLKTIGINTKISFEEHEFLRTNTSWEVHYERSCALLFYKEINFPGLKCGGITWFLQPLPSGSGSKPLQTCALGIDGDSMSFPTQMPHMFSHLVVGKKDGCEQLCKNFWQNKYSTCFCLFSIFLNENS